MRKITTGIYEFVQIFLIMASLFSCSQVPLGEIKTGSDNRDPFLRKIEKRRYDIQRCYRAHHNIDSIIIYFNITKRAQVKNIATIPASNVRERQCLSLILLSLDFEKIPLEEKMKIRAHLTF